MKLEGLLDSSILIDVLREYQPALVWLRNRGRLFLGLPSVVRMELILGTANQNEQQRLQRAIARYPIIYPNEDDAEWALGRFETYHLSHSVDILDCFIAAIGYRTQLPIYTRNVKHFTPFKDVRLVEPY
jgi:predicted nucleic acid-binding protein